MQWNAKIPRGIPGILPFVRHRDYVGIVEMRPVGVPSMETFMRRIRHPRITDEPAFQIIMVELFAPQ